MIFFLVPSKPIQTSEKKSLIDYEELKIVVGDESLAEMVL